MAQRYDELDNFNLSEYDYNTDEEFTLESILAEYKGNAFIEGERKTPSDILNQKAEEIIKSVKGEAYVPSDKKEELPENSGEEEHGIANDEEHIEKETEPAVEVQKNEEVTVDTSQFIEENEQIYEQNENEPLDVLQDAESEKVEEEDTSSDSGNEPVAEAVDADEPKPKKRRLNFSSLFSPSDEYFEDTEDDSANASSSEIGEEESANDTENKTVEDGMENEYQYSSPDETGITTNSGYKDRVSLIDRFIAFIHGDRTSSAQAEDDEDTDVTEYFTEDDYISESYVLEEEPDFKEETRRFVGGLASLALRELIILGVCGVAILLNILFEAGVNIPFGIGRNPVLFSGILLIFQLSVMALGIEVVISGISDLIKLTPGAESIIFISSVFTAVDALAIVLSKDASRGLPFCIVSIVALYFAVVGRKSYRLAMAESFRMASASSLPSAVIADSESIESRTILKKVRSDLSGFWRMATVSDITEDTYSLAAPLLLVAALIFALMSTFARHSIAAFPHIFSSLLAVSASFSSVIAFAVPFRIATRSTGLTGGAIAGWGGASVISECDGAIITDSDIFPKGTVSLSGIRVFDPSETHKVVSYAGSLIILSQSGLSEVVRDFMRTRGISRVNVDRFNYYEGGGLSGSVFGEKVLVGSSGFMNLMGVRIPNNIYEKNAVFAAIDNKISGVFLINYSPSNSVRNAIMSLLRSKVSMLFAAKDANITPVMLQQKFKIAVDGIEYIPIDDCYKIANDEIPDGTESLGVVCRAGLSPFASVISNARKLKNLSMMTTLVSVVSSIIGLLFVFFLCWSGTFAINTAINILLYLGLVQAIVYLLIFVYNRL